MGALDDGSILFLDNALLQEFRMEEAGLNVFHEQFTGGHSRKVAVIERLADIAWQESAGTD